MTELNAYRAPKGEYARLPIRNVSSINQKQKKISYFEDAVNAKKVVPSPAIYQHIPEWCLKGESGVNRGKGKFLTDARVTSTEAFYVQQKKFGFPGPNNYHNLQAWRYSQGKIPGTYNNKDVIVNFTDEEKFHSM